MRCHRNDSCTTMRSDGGASGSARNAIFGTIWGHSGSGGAAWLRRSSRYAATKALATA